jgi:serine/threonine protein kinase
LVTAIPFQVIGHNLYWIKMQVRNDKARKYLTEMRKKQPVPFAQKFPNADPSAHRLLQRLLAFDPKDRPTAEEVCALLHLLALRMVSWNSILVDV